VVTEPTVPVVDLNAAPVRSSLRVRLLGTLVNEGAPEWSIASVQDVVTLRSSTYMLQDRIQGAEVIAIERLRVVVINNNRREFIDGTPGDGSAVAMAPPPPVARNEQAPGSVALGTTVKQLSENDYEIPRAEIDKTLSNLNDVAMQARIVPAFKDGKAQGFKLFSIRPDSIYTKIGIQNGDVIQRINGYDLNSPEKALEIYSKLKESSRIDIEVERNGTPVKKTYNVR
jgi:general secretion pathway protein C